MKITSEPGFGTLPAVFCRKLCTHLSINDLLSCAGVNRHWRAEVAAYSRTIRSIRIISPPNTTPHTLKAFADALNVRKYQLTANLIIDKKLKRFKFRHLFICWRLPAPFVRHFVRLFPNLRELSFAFELEVTSCTLNGLLRLLSAYQDQLASLSIRIRVLWAPKAALSALFFQLNRMSGLRRLSLRFDFRLKLKRIQLRALAWLHEFSFACVERNQNNILAEFFRLYGAQNPQLIRISYKCDFLSDQSVPEVLARRLTQFETNCPRGLPDSIAYGRLVARFPALTHLNLRMYLNSWHGALRCLHGLAHLVDLRISLGIDSARLLTQDARARALGDDARPLSSVRTLVLSVSNRSIETHVRLHCLRLGEYFPAIERLQFYWMTSLNGSDPFYDEPLCGACFASLNTEANVENVAALVPIDDPMMDIDDDLATVEGDMVMSIPEVYARALEEATARNVAAQHEWQNRRAHFRFDSRKHCETFFGCARALLKPWKGGSSALKFVAINDEIVELAQLFH